jgi:hypothetical protein
MRRFPFLLTALVLALFVLVAGPVAADTSGPEPTVEIDLAEAPTQTPVETPEDLDELTVEQLQRENRIRECTEQEAAQCPYGCDCIYISYVRCLC